MRTFKQKLIAILMFMTMVVSLTGIIPTTSYAAQSEVIPIYRLYCKVTGEHLYTTDVNERNTLYATSLWGYEGVAWYADTTGTPVYRLYNSGLKNHLYTTNPEEINALLQIKEWSIDNDGKPVFYSNGFVPIYRVYNRDLNGMHHLTTDLNEYNTLPQYGWTQEGVSIYARAIGAQIQTQYYPTALPATPEANIPIQTEGTYTIENVSADTAIEADITLNGSGTGCHAKLVLCTATSAVSFGLQYDTCAKAPYTGKTMLLIENVSSNDSGGQTYDRPSNQEAALGQTCHLMITLNKDGTGDVYLNKNKIGSYTNKDLANQQIYLRVEGSARLNGDSVDATFTNIKLKSNGVYNPNKVWGTHDFTTCDSIKSTVTSSNSVEISGTVSGLGSNEDWDSAYDKVSGIIQFVE
jgi:hypothetical protein